MTDLAKQEALEAERRATGNGRDRAPPPGARDERHVALGADGMPVTGLVRRLVEDVATLFRKELAMATSEVLHSVHEAKVGMTSAIGGTAVLYAGFLFLLVAATIGLSEVMQGWAAALVVGGAAVIIGLIMIQASKRKLQAQAFAPSRTAEALRKDRELVRRQTP